MIGTSSIAILLTIVAALVLFTSVGTWLRHLPGRAIRFIQDFFYQRKLKKEHLKQEKLKTEILEEKLRNEEIRSFMKE